MLTTRSRGIGRSKPAMTVAASTTSLRTVRWPIPNAFEIYTIINPGQGVNKTIDGYASFLTSLGAAYGPGVPAFNANRTTSAPVPVPEQP